jgi:hypothetical protein
MFSLKITKIELNPCFHFFVWQSISYSRDSDSDFRVVPTQLVSCRMLSHHCMTAEHLDWRTSSHSILSPLFSYSLSSPLLSSPLLSSPLLFTSLSSLLCTNYSSLLFTLYSSLYSLLMHSHTIFCDRYVCALFWRRKNPSLKCLNFLPPLSSSSRFPLIFRKDTLSLSSSHTHTHTHTHTQRRSLSHTRTNNDSISLTHRHTPSLSPMNAPMTASVASVVLRISLSNHRSKICWAGPTNSS